VSEERASRRLAVILAADVVGYSRLMEVDEAGTLAALKARRKDVLGPLVTKHGGRIFKFTGDGVLIEFGSAVNAVQCAVDLQQGMATANASEPEDRHINLRVGVNLGDVMVDGSDLYGDGVNIAARLEAIAEPGGVYVSEDAYRQVRNKLKLSFDDLGAQNLKNIAEPVRAYRLAGRPAVTVAPPKASADKPSIAVLPFTNMSGDPEQEYFSDGMVEEIITALSRMRSLFVVARNSSFYYKGRPISMKQVGRELGVRYVLEGSVRKAANRLRITGQLIDTETGAHLWADRFDGDMEDIFDLQDQVTAKVVGAIAPKLDEAEIERIRSKPTESFDAYDYFLRGMAGLHKWSREGNDEALAHFYRAIELDPNYAAAHGLAARTYLQRNAGGWVTDRAREVAEASRLARRAVELGHDDAVALATAGFALAALIRDIEDGDAFIDAALGLNPNLAWAWLYSGWVKAQMGDVDRAIERIARAKRLSPHDPQDLSIQTAMSFAHFIAERYGEALACAQSAVRIRSNFQIANCLAAASAALAGRPDEARKAMERVREVNPNLRLADVGTIVTIHRPEDIARWADALRQAGLPE
jgi:TolB-like protein/Tfp pilus assembly protein PilF